MNYQEFQPRPIFSEHVECFWELELMPDEVTSPFEVWVPDCTFDILFSEYPFSLRFAKNGRWENINSGAVFVGLKSSCVQWCIPKVVRVFGVRFMPFAFAGAFPVPPNRLNDSVYELTRLFDLSVPERNLIRSVTETALIEEKIFLCEKLIIHLLRNEFFIDQNFRAQVNYILDRRGLIRIRDLFGAFGTSKVTLHKHFLNKMGLSPKKVSRIWRLNYFLQLQKDNPHYNLTEIALEAGYYDQAHLIREFKAFFHHHPGPFFRGNYQLMKISQDIIAKRFSNQYDPLI